jgi:hypothetical protein
MPGVFGTLLGLRNVTRRTNLCEAVRSSALRAWDTTDGPRCVFERGATRSMFAVFILLGLMFGTSLGYLALAALRAAKSTTKDETVPVVATNAPNPPLGNGWEYAFYATRESSSKEPPKVPV